MRNLIETESMNKKANPYLVGFVFACILVIVGLLYIDQKSMAVVESLSKNYTE